MEYLGAQLSQRYDRNIFVIYMFRAFHSRIKLQIWIIFHDFSIGAKSVKIRKTKIAKTFPIFKFDTAMESSEYVDYKNASTILLRQRSAEKSELKERAAALRLILLSSLTT